MFWGDEIADEIEKKYARQIADGNVLRIRDEKTLSGRVHVGSLRGVVLHGLISEVLTERGIKNEYLFELNDIDPMDGLPSYLDEKTFRPHMGKPLHLVPSPNPSAKNFADYWGKEFVGVINKIGITPTFYYIRDVYQSGAFNEAIRLSLEHAEQIRGIYKTISGSEKPSDWLPLNVICEQCSRVGTTKVMSFDGNKVRYRCEPAMVTWAQGCGYEGSMEPWNGNAKMPFKVEWAAKFAYLPRPIASTTSYGVDIEGAGKDHATKGGTRDIADHICTEIFKHPAPFDIPYNFFVVGGKKMGSSSGTGSSAFEIAELLPPELTRFLMIRKQPKHEIEFLPEGNTIPLLYDEYDRTATAYFDETHDRMDDPVRFFHFAQMPTLRASVPNAYRPRFSLVSFMVQMPHLDIMHELESMKGATLTAADRTEIENRATYAKQWLDKYVPESYKFVLQQSLPASAASLSTIQRDVLKQILVFLNDNPAATGEEIHQRLHTLKTELSAQPKDIFEPLYKIFLDKTSGPQAGWFLRSLDREFVLRRLEEATR